MICLYPHCDINIVPGDDLLPSNRDNLNLDVHNAKGFGADVDLDQSWIDRLVKLSESLDKSNRSLLNVSERVREGAAGNSTAEADAVAQVMHHGTIESMCNFSRTKILSVRRLHLAPLQGFDVNDLLACIGPLHRWTRGLLDGDYTKAHIRIQQSLHRLFKDEDSP